MGKKRYVILASSYDKRNRLIYSCTNSYTDSSALMRYYAMKAGKPKSVYNHAEIRCIEVSVLKMKKTIDKLVVVRLDSDASFKDSKPCSICSLAITDFKIKNVFYSTEHNGMQKL